MSRRFRMVCIVAIALVAGILLFVVNNRSDTNVIQTKSDQKTNKPAAFDRSKYSKTDPTSPWVVVNKQHPLTPITYAPTDLKPIGNGMEMRKEAANAYLHMSTAAQKAGYTLTPQSGYRSYDYQVQVYNSIATGYSKEYAETYSAHPGYSEHQSGWAVDIGSGDCNVDECFATLPAGKWVYANAYKYGFILRYTPADEAITGYGAEAWHFRYVGASLATEMHEQNVATLEQFFGIAGGSTYKE